MAAYDEAVVDFLAQTRIAGQEVFAVNPAAEILEGGPCYRDLASIPGGAVAVVIMTPPQAAEGIVRDCARPGITRVWPHRTLGRGSSSEAAVRAAAEAKITPIPAGCPDMFCDPDRPTGASGGAWR
jgi:predicted CoA-binding protein